MTYEEYEAAIEQYLRDLRVDANRSNVDPEFRQDCRDQHSAFCEMMAKR